MEDDKRSWNDHQTVLRRRQSARHDEESSLDWSLVEQLAATPRAVPIPARAGSPGVAQVANEARLIANVLPEGSNWDGKTELLIDEKTYEELTGHPSDSPSSAAGADRIESASQGSR